MKLLIIYHLYNDNFFLWQCLAERLAAGVPRDDLVYVSFEDDRLMGMQASDLAWLVEEYYRLRPNVRDRRVVTFCFDEIQTIPGWETFARRLLDTERVQLFISGSSARLLSREITSSMRGRAMGVLVHPFSFREALRHAGVEPKTTRSRIPKAVQSDLNHRLRSYLIEGGFPEASGAEPRDRFALLRSYVDVVVLRDVIERHAVTNPLALRWMQRQLLANAGAPFSIQKFYNALRSQGIAVGKDTLHLYLGYLEDTFLIRTVGLHTASERQRMVNPRKAYPVDPGLIPVYERTTRSNLGHALETAVLVELERRGYQSDYVRTPEGLEIDFLAQAAGQPPHLIQVCLDASDPEALKREVRTLSTAAGENPGCSAWLVTLDPTPPKPALPAPLQWRSAADWLLEPVEV